MNILYICNTDPNLSSFGNEQRTHYLYESLKSVGQVYAANLNIWPHTPTESVPEIVYLPQTGWQRIVNGLWMRFCKLFFPELKLYWVPFGHRSNLDKVFPGVKFDLVVKRYVYGLGHAHLWNIAPVYVDVDDYLMEVYKTTCLPTANGFRRTIACLMQKIHLRMVERRIEGGWIANPRQVSLVKFRSCVEVLKNIPSFPSSLYDYKCQNRYLLFTVGIMNYKPNYAGVDEFLSSIWPVVHKRFPKLEYHVVGRGAPADYAERWERIEGVKVRGFVEDLSGLYEHAFASVVPIAQGGGTCIKTLESLAYSRACLSTEFGLRGLTKADILASKGALNQYVDAESFCGLLSRLIDEPEYRHECEEAGRRLVLKLCSPEQFRQAVVGLLG